MKIAFLGYGEAARAFRATLADVDPDLSFAAYDIVLDTQGANGPCALAMKADDVEIAPTPERLAASADWVVSAVTADQSVAAAQSIASHLIAGQVVFDINSVSAPTKCRTAGLFAPVEALYLDMAVMAPVLALGHRTPVLVAGPVDDLLADALKRLRFDFEVVSHQVGAAAALKLVRSLFVKGLEAITIETLLAAQGAGCLEYVMRSLEKSYPGLGLRDLAPYHFERALRHGRRRAAEMRQCAAALDELGLTGRLAEAIAEVEDAMGSLENNPLSHEMLEAGLQELLSMRRRVR